MKSNTIFPALVFLLITGTAWTQQKVGVGTTSPARQLEIRGSGTQYLRVQSNATIGNEAGIELLRGTDANNARDWKITNYSLGLRFATSTDNFATAQTKMLLSADGNLGIGVLNPAARVHVGGGESATNTNDGYLLVGQKTGTNLVFDNNGLIARSNGSASPLFIQSEGGNSFLGYAGGSSNTYVSNGNVVVGGGADEALLSIRADDDFQLHVTNTGNSGNKWNIGASNQNWAVGDDQLVFTPTNSSADAPLRLMDVGDNDGNVAPVVIQSSPTQTMLLDGNEIDTKSGPLYINHNSDNNTYVNPSGGSVGIGTTNPHGRVHVVTSNFALALQRESTWWKLAPTPSGDVMFSNDGNGVVALISYNGGGAWVALSDSTRKQQVKPLNDAMDKIRRIALHSYDVITGGPPRSDFGVLAQDLEQVVPEAVFRNEGQYGVTYDQLTALALRGVQEQQEEIEALLARAAKLKEQKK